MSEPKLIKVDRNGTKHYEGLCTCDRCGGSGIFVVAIHNGVGVPARPDHGTCYKCHGDGKVKGTWKEYTPEYRAKLDARREERAKKKRLETERKQREEASENSKKWLADHGFAPDGTTFILLGDTFSGKDEIKAAGGCYDGSIGWHSPHPIDGFQAIKVHVDEIAEKSYWGRYEITATRIEWDTKKKEALQQLSGVGPAGYYGSVGDKISLNVELVRSSWYKCKSFAGYGTDVKYIHQMADSDGHIFIWNTGIPLDRVVDGECKQILPGESFTVSATIKAHNEYKDQKQTVLIRCRVK